MLFFSIYQTTSINNKMLLAPMNNKKLSYKKMKVPQLYTITYTLNLGELHINQSDIKLSIKETICTDKSHIL